jgi:hypothetical protein
MPRARHPLLRNMLLGLGFVLIVAAPIAGPIPGPGGILLFAAGLILVLRNSAWARKRFARLKKRYPKLGHYSDLALRRPSFRRRRAREQEATLAASQPEPGNADRTR